MKTLYFTVALTFESSIVDDTSIAEITDNIGRALYNEVDSGVGLVPEASDTWTTEIVVSPEYLDYQYHKLT